MDEKNELVGKAHSALEWCIEVIGEEDKKRGVVPKEHADKIEEINKLIADLATVVDTTTVPKEQEQGAAIQQVEFTLQDGRKFSVKRLL